MAKGEFAVRLPVESKDEFGALARGFNDMAEHLQESYRNLEGRVADKTRSLAAQNARLATLYDMTAFLNAPNSLENLCRGFLTRLLAATGAAAGTVRLVARESDTLHLFVHEGLTPAFAEKEHCLQRNECACGEAVARSAATVHALGDEEEAVHDHAAPLPRCRLQRRRRGSGRRAASGPRHLQPVLPGAARDLERGTAHAGESRPAPWGRHREPAARLERSRARDRRGAQPARTGAARLDRAGARLPQPADADAAEGADRARSRRDDAHPRRDPGRRAGVLRRRARVARALPHPACRRRRRTRNPHAARPARAPDRRCAPSFAPAERRCRSHRTTSCR